MTEDVRPARLQKVVEQIRCPRCDAERAKAEVLVTTTRLGHAWKVLCACLACGYKPFGFVLHLDDEEAATPVMIDGQVREATGEDVPQPDWYVDLMGRRE